MTAIFNILQNGLLISSAKQSFIEGWNYVCLSIDGVIYTFIGHIYRLFLIIANARIFSDTIMEDFVVRIYQLVGVIMLFVLTYAFLRRIISPDGKDKESPTKMVLNIVKAIVLLAIVPSLFNFAYKIQSSVLTQNTIGKIILGNSSKDIGGEGGDAKETITNGGKNLAISVFDAFFFPTSGDENVIVYEKGSNQLTYKQVRDEVQTTGDFSVYKNCTEAIYDGTITYYEFIAFIAGLFVIYMLISYCISLGFRAAKLAFYEIAAPICIIASILPSQKDMLNRWIKTTLQVFLEVFIRIAILYFVVYLLEAIKQNRDAIFVGATGPLKAFGFIVIVIGLLTFMKAAPDLISKLTGIDSGNMKLGIGEQLKNAFSGGLVGGALGAAGFVGGAIAGHSLSAGWRARKTTKDGDFSSIGRERMRRRDEQDAIDAATATAGPGANKKKVARQVRKQMRQDRLRRQYGLDTAAANADYELENRDFEVKDENGGKVKMDFAKRTQLQQEKEANNTAIEEINQEMRKKSKIVSANDQATQFRATVKSEALDEIHKDNNDITRTLTYSFTDSSGATVTKSISGNYNSLKQQIDQLVTDGIIKDNEVNNINTQLGNAEKSMWMEFASDAATNANGANGHKNGKIYAAYQKLIDNEAHSQYQTGSGASIVVAPAAINFTSGTTGTTYSYSEANMKDLQDRINADIASGAIHVDDVDEIRKQMNASQHVEDLFAAVSGASNEISIEQEAQNRKKAGIESRNETIDSMFAQREKQIAEEKQKTEYLRKKQASEFNDKYSASKK